MNKKKATVLLAVFGSIGGIELSVLSMFLLLLFLYFIIILGGLTIHFVILPILMLAVAFALTQLQRKLEENFGIKRTVFLICISAAPIIIFLLLLISAEPFDVSTLTGYEGMGQGVLVLMLLSALATPISIIIDMLLIALIMNINKRLKKRKTEEKQA